MALEKRGVYISQLCVLTSCQSHITSAITSEALYPCLCVPHFSSNLCPLIFLLLWLMGEEWWPFGMREQSGGFAGSVPYFLPADRRAQGTCSVQPGHLHPGHRQIAWVKLVLITPSATIQPTSPSGIFLPGKAVPCVVTSHFAASHSWYEKKRNEKSIVGR